MIWSSLSSGGINKLIFCTKSNISQVFASAVPFDFNKNDADDGSSDFVIAIKRDVSFDGGVTNEFFKDNQGMGRDALERSRLL